MFAGIKTGFITAQTHLKIGTTKHSLVSKHLHTKATQLRRCGQARPKMTSCLA